MTANLKALIDATAIRIVTTSDDCLFKSSKVQKTQAILTELVNRVVAELNPQPPKTPDEK